MSAKHVHVYTDGACSGNPGPGGWAAILRWNGYQRDIGGCEPQTTNNRMELAAVIGGLKALSEPCMVTVYTDSQYVIGVMNGWKRKANHDLLCELDALCAEHTVTFRHIRGHSGHPLNERADVLAAIQREKARSAAQIGPPSNPPPVADPLRPRRALPSGFEQAPTAISDMAPIGAG